MNGTNVPLVLLITALLAPTMVSALGEIVKYLLNVSLSKLEVRNQARMKLHKSCEMLLGIAINTSPDRRIRVNYEFQNALQTIAVFGDEESSDYAIDLLNGQHPIDIQSIFRTSKPRT